MWCTCVYGLWICSKIGSLSLTIYGLDTLETLDYGCNSNNKPVLNVFTPKSPL